MSTPIPTSSDARSSGSSAASLFQFPSRQVRHHWWQHLMCVWRHISRRSKIILAVVLFSLLTQIVVLSTVLSLEWKKTCDRPLKPLLLAYLICVILSTPLTLYDRFRRAISSANQQQQQPLQAVPEEGWFFNFVTAVLDWLYLLLFLLGNYYFFTSVTCSSSAPLLYYLTLVFLVMGYLMLTVPMLLCGAVVFCLPIMLVSMRMTGMGTMENIDGTTVAGASEESINCLSLWTFRANLNKQLSDEEVAALIPPSAAMASPPETTTTAEGAAAATATAAESSEKPLNTPANIMKKQSTRWLVVMKGDSGGEVYVECEHANCIICLECYEEGQQVRQLPCQHLFHQKCVDEWLQLNATCPLCKQPISSKECPPLSISHGVFFSLL